MKKQGLWLILMGGAALGCGAEDTTSTLPGDTSTAGAAAGEPTFWQDVAPILSAKCTACHQTGGIAPFPLDNFGDAQRRANLIADMTESRVMPPYLMNTGDDCGSFDESGALTLDEIATILAWARGDRLEGSSVAMTPSELPSLPDGIDLFTPEFTPEIEGGALAEFDEYRCFMLDTGLTEPTFVTGFEFEPGNSAIVHHVIAMLVDPNAASGVAGLSNAQAIARLDGADAREGWHCFGEAGDGVQVESAPGAWAPGAGPYTYPEGVGVRLQPDRKLIVQVHYNLARPEARGQSDRTRLRLQVKNTVQRQAALMLNDAFLRTLRNDPPDMLAPGNPAARYSWTLSGAELGLPPGVPVDVVMVSPHMHQRGRKFTIEFGRDGAFECQGQVNRWDFNWQRPYTYRTPPTLDDSSLVRVSCEYDTSADTAPVLPGWGTRNEMCELTMAIVFPPDFAF